MEFSDIIMEFLLSLLYHIVEFLWSLEILYKILTPQFSWSFMEFHYHMVEFFFLTLTPFNGILLEFSWCVKNILQEIWRIYRKSGILWSNILKHVKALI